MDPSPYFRAFLFVFSETILQGKKIVLITALGAAIPKHSDRDTCAKKGFQLCSLQKHLSAKKPAQLCVEKEPHGYFKQLHMENSSSTNGEAYK